MERPILFSGEMVRAILEGRKTMTRRIVKEPTKGWLDNANGSHRVVAGEVFNYSCEQHLGVCPLGKPKDRLYVRETFRLSTSNDCACYEPCDCKSGVPIYFADCGQIGEEKWTPSIHMPKWASRIWLEINDISVERLQDISEEDADAEGFGGDFPCRVMPNIFTEGDEYWGQYSIVECFKHLWESINGSGSWEVNPWVFVISFEVIK